MYTYYGGIIIVVVPFKVSSGLLTQDGALLCKAQGGQVVRNAPVLTAVMEMTRSLVRSPPGATVSGSWPVKICLNGNSVKDTVKQTQMYIWDSRTRPVEAGRKYCVVPYRRRKTSAGFSVEAMLLY